MLLFTVVNSATSIFTTEHERERERERRERERERERGGGECAYAWLLFTVRSEPCKLIGADHYNHTRSILPLI